MNPRPALPNQTLGHSNLAAHFGVLAMILLALAVFPFAASATCGGNLAGLESYASKYRAEADLLDAPALDAILAHLPGNEHLHLQRNLDVSGPIQLADCHLVVSGNAPHMGTEQDAMLDVDLASDTVIAAIHGGGRIDIYVLADQSTTPRWDALPRAMREWVVRADMGFPRQQPRNLAQPGSVRLHAVSVTATPAIAVPRTTAKPRSINFDRGATKPTPPTPAQATAIQRAAGDDLAQPLPGHAGEPLYSMALADLNDDGHADLIVQYSYAAGACGSAGCSGIIVMATAQGYTHKQIGLPNFTELAVLPSMHRGMHDLQFDGDSPIWQWTGSEYEIPKADLPQSHASAWVTRQAAGHPMMAVATPIDSTIKKLLVFCEQGTPLLAMVTKMPRPAGPTTLTFVFRGWTVNVSLQQNTQAPQLWVANLSRSDLPMWLAHRGTNSQTSELARLADMSFLRINGAMEGQISLANSTAATQAALASCYRY